MPPCAGLHGDRSLEVHCKNQNVDLGAFATGQSELSRYNGTCTCTHMHGQQTRGQVII